MQEQAVTHEQQARLGNLGVLWLGRARHVVSALTWDNPIVWRRLHGRHPLADLEGQEYLPFAPYRDTDLATEAERATGVPVELEGRLYDRTTGQTVGYAVLDVWQASPSTGRYSGADHALRGRFRVGASGRYLVRTVMPPTVDMRILSKLDRALLGLPAKTVEALAGEHTPLERPPHIHVIVRAFGYRPLTTQLYFTASSDEAPPDAANALRPWRPALELEPRLELDGERLVARFDFALDPREETATASATKPPERAAGRAPVQHIPTPPREEGITARPTGSHQGVDSILPDEGLSLDSDDLAPQMLANATEQGNFETLYGQQMPADEDPSVTDDIAPGAPLADDESAWEASVTKAFEESEDEDEDER